MERKMRWREISACNYCKRYNPKNSYCEDSKKELTIYEELRGCEQIDFTGNLKITLFKDIPEDSILRKLSIKSLSKANNELKNDIASKAYGDYFNEPLVITSTVNLANSEKEGKIISFEKFKEAQEKFKRKKIEARFLSLSDHLD